MLVSIVGENLPLVRLLVRNKSLLLRLLLAALIAFSFSDGFSASNSDPVCGTYPERVVTELALHRQYANQRVRSGYTMQASPAAAAVDHGNIAVIPDDGTLVMPANLFDLDQKSLTFQPAATGYSVAAGEAPFDADAGAAGVLLNDPAALPADNIGDDGTREVALGFPFSYFGKSYSTVFINSDGNLTFLKGDTATTERSLARFLSGAPRIAPYFADLNPAAGGRLTYSSSDTRFVVTWNQVPDWVNSGTGPAESFQLILTPNGGIQFAYNGIHGRDAVVGISPGGFTGVPSLSDFSRSRGESLDGPLAEIFIPATRLDLAAVTQRFYQSHDDAYDYLMMFTTFDFDLRGAFAFELNVSNQVTGIGQIAAQPVFNYSAEFGSARLQSFVNMGNLGRYPSDPSAVFFRGVDSTLSLLGQESGHRFLAYVTFDDQAGNRNSNTLLGRDLQHWSFLFNSDASVMEGNRIRDNGDGTFTTIGAVEHYSDLDQYLMGLRFPEEVSPSFVVTNPDNPISPGRAPALDVTFPGKRLDVTIDQIVSSNGPRVPAADVSPKNFNFAFVLVVPKGESPSDAQVSHLDTIRQGWEGFFARATSFRGTANTSLVPAVALSPKPSE